MTIRQFVENAAQKNGQKTFLYYGAKEVTYIDLDQNINRYASAMKGQGVHKGDRVAMMMTNSPEFLYLWLGLAKMGAVAVPLNTAYRAKEIQYALSHSQSRMIVANGTFAEAIKQVQPSCPALETTIFTGQVPSGELSLTSLAEEAPPMPPEYNPSEDDPVMIIYTSGTTGKPKGVVQTHRTYTLTGEAFPLWLGLSPSDRLFTCLPLAHINAQAYSTMGSIGANASLILSERFSASQFWNQVAAHEATEFNSIGAMMMILHKQPPSEADRQHKVRLVYCALALPEEIVRAMEERFGFRIIVGYGMTETTFGTVETLTYNVTARKFGTMGLPRQHPTLGRVNELRIVDQNGNDVPTRAVGEILLKNPAIMKEYLNDTQKTAETVKNGWLYTGDLAYRDEDGYVYFFGRKKEIIRRRGENISPGEIEEVINRHPLVLECAVIPVPSELTEDDIKAYIVPRPAGTPKPEEIIKWCEERLARFKVPRYIEFRESLPKTATERVEKHVLSQGKKDLRVGSYDGEIGRIVEG